MSVGNLPRFSRSCLRGFESDRTVVLRELLDYKKVCSVRTTRQLLTSCVSNLTRVEVNVDAIYKDAIRGRLRYLYLEQLIIAVRELAAELRGAFEEGRGSGAYALKLIDNVKDLANLLHVYCPTCSEEDRGGLEKLIEKLARMRVTAAVDRDDADLGSGIKERLREKLEAQRKKPAEAPCESLQEFQDAVQRADAAAAALEAEENLRISADAKRTAKGAKRRRGARRRAARKADLAAEERAALEECIFCMDAHSDVTLHPCGHCVLCEACAEEVLAAKPECPYCRGQVDRTS